MITRWIRVPQRWDAFYAHLGVAGLGAGPRYRTRAGLFKHSGHGARLGAAPFGPGLCEIMHLGIVQLRGQIRGRGSLGSYNIFRVNEWNESTIKILGFQWFLTKNSISGPSSGPGIGTGLGAYPFGAEASGGPKMFRGRPEPVQPYAHSKAYFRVEQKAKCGTKDL